jgi:hypothetical protein
VNIGAQRLTFYTVSHKVVVSYHMNELRPLAGSAATGMTLPGSPGEQLTDNRISHSPGQGWEIALELT